MSKTDEPEVAAPARAKTDMAGILMLLCVINTVATAGALLFGFATGALSIGKLGDILAVLREEVRPAEVPITEQEAELRNRVDEHGRAVAMMGRWSEKTDLQAQSTLDKLALMKAEIARAQNDLDKEIAAFEQRKKDAETADAARREREQSEEFKQLIKTVQSLEADTAYALLTNVQPGGTAGAPTPVYSDEEIKDILLKLDPEQRAEILSLFFTSTSKEDPKRGAAIIKLIGR